MSLFRRTENRNYRVVVLGSSGVGKTSIISKHLYSKFPEKHKETVDEVHRHAVIIESMNVEIDILDSCGSNEFPAMRKLAIKTGDAFLLVYSADKPGSFEHVKRLLEDISALKEDKDFFSLVIANKIDIEKHSCEQVINETTVCLEWEEEFLKISAKTGENIEKVFQTLEQKIKRRLEVESYKLPQQRRISLPDLKFGNHKKEKSTKFKLKSRSFSIE